MLSDRNMYLFAIVLTVLAYWINKNNVVSFSLLIVLTGMLITAFSIKKGAVFFFLCTMAFSDYTYEGVFGIAGEEEGAPLGGIYMAGVAGSTLIVYWSLFNLLMVFLKRGAWALHFFLQHRLFRVFGVVFCFSILGLVINLFSNAQQVPTTAVSDVRFFVNTSLGFLTVICIIENREDLKRYFSLFILIFLTQIVLTIYSAYVVSQTRMISNFFSGTESYLLGCAFLYLLILLTSKENNAGFFSPSLVNVVGLLLIVLFLFVVAARGRMLGLAISLIFYIIYSKKVGYMALMPLLVIASIYLVQWINPKFYNYFMWKFTTFNPMAEGGESSKIRFVSFVNIFHELTANPYYFLFGKGFGGYFEDQFMPFGGLLSNGGFSEKWIAEGKFYKPHGMTLYSLLKYGVVMAGIIFFTILRISYDGLRGLRRYKKDWLWALNVSVFISLPFFFLVIYSSKLQLMFGMILGFAVMGRFFIKHTTP